MRYQPESLGLPRKNHGTEKSDTLEAIHEDYPHIDIQTLSSAIDEAIEALNTTLHAKKVL